MAGALTGESFGDRTGLGFREVQGLKVLELGGSGFRGQEGFGLEGFGISGFRRV